MKVRVCRDCAFSKTRGGIRTCTKYAGTNYPNDIRQLAICPMGYTEEDIDWAELKCTEDAVRRRPLYAR